MQKILQTVYRNKGDSQQVGGGNHLPKVVLLVEDNPGDVRLLQEAFHDSDGSAPEPIALHVVFDGFEALAFLRREGVHLGAPRPDLILLDLNLPKVAGHEVLARIKVDDSLKSIPTIVLSSSQAEADVVRSYQLHANCFLEKPRDWDSFIVVARSLSDFWLKNATFAPDRKVGELREETHIADINEPPRKRDAIRVLHIDDDPDMRNIVELALGLDPSITLTSCRCAEDAIAIADDLAPDLILCDVSMPGMDGMAMLARLRESPVTAKIPFVFLTANVRAQERDKLLALGSVAVITKPFKPLTFAEVVRDQMRSMRAREV